MALPKIQHKLYDHFLVGLNKTVKFRAFTVAEQKILLMAKEESKDKTPEEKQKDIVNAVSQIVQNCTLGKVNPEELCTFDLEDLFLRLRAKSVGEVFTVKYAEHYQDEEDRKQTNFIDVVINLDQIKVVKNEVHDNKIMVTDDIGVIMRYPTFKMISECKDSNDLSVSCIESIFDQSEIYEASTHTRKELEEFYSEIEAQPLTQIKKFFDDMPKLRHSVDVTLHDGSKQTLIFEGLESFFN